MLCLSFTLLALFVSVQGRAVNISNTWVLPEEGFPVFYRYFRDRISWYEADAVCQFHHANLVTVDTTAQYDAVRAYLKELDISSAVWVGLIRSNPDGDFTWTDYRGLSGEGYWSSAPDARAAPLCAAADPAADYRWEARACGGPSVASFICELPVPQWALGKDGCMVRALPALTALYLPESAAVQLTADCGLAGVKRVQCTGNVKREELLKELSCNDEDESSSTQSLTSSTMWPATETTIAEQEVTTDELLTTNNVVTEQKETSVSPAHSTGSSITYDLQTEPEIHTSTKQNLNLHDLVRVPLNKVINVETIHSNDIPQPYYQEKSIYNRHIKTVEENKKYQHRLLHDEMTRLGNLDTIFTQPTDHFVPPLVMAKARISDDMTVLSLEEKHAQQIAEQRLHKHNKLVEHVSATSPHDTSSTSISSTPTSTKMVKEQKPTGAPTLNGSTKKDMKASVPKKYIDKYDNPKAKTWRTITNKVQKFGRIDTISTIQHLTKETETTTAKLEKELLNNSEEDPTIDLTVIIKEPGTGNGQQIFYSNHTNTMASSEQVTTQIDTDINKPEVNYSTTDTPILTTAPVTNNKSQGASAVTLNHQVIKITVIDDKTSSEGSTPLTFEVSTLIPVFNNNSGEIKEEPSSTVTHIVSSSTNDFPTSTTTIATINSSTQSQQSELRNDKYSGSVSTSTGNIAALKENIVSTTESPVTTHEITTDAVTFITTVQSVNENTTKNVVIDFTTTAKSAVTLNDIYTTEKKDLFNHTDNFEEVHEQEEHDTETIDDYQSPLLSAANEPLHRPSRSRRPLPPAKRINKFNPFRILG